MMTQSNRAAVEAEFQRVLQGRSLRTVFQPIVSVSSRQVIGHECLVRGPAGSILESPSVLIKEAYREHRVVEFDWIARASACRAALTAGLRPDDVVFLNIEPLALASSCPPDLEPDIEAAFHKFRIVLEVTERSLDHDLRTLLENIDRWRPAVSGVAIDDVGADARALSMLPALEPDVIKLDMNITQATPSAAAMKVLALAFEEIERTGATMLAEGVETEDHHDVIGQLGAPLAQGYLYGKPTDQPRPAQENPAANWRRVDAAIDQVRYPFEALGGQTISHATAEVLISLRDEVFVRGMHHLDPSVVIALVPDPKLLDHDVLRQLARRGVVSAALGPGVPPAPAPGVRGSWQHDPALDREWAMVVLGPHCSVAMLARRQPGTESHFQYGLTHDRHRVIAAARCLMRYIGPRPDAN